MNKVEEYDARARLQFISTTRTIRRIELQATSAFRKVEISRRMLVSLMVAPLAAFMLGGAGGYTFKTITATTAPAAAQVQPIQATASQGKAQGENHGIPARNRTGLQQP